MKEDFKINLNIEIKAKDPLRVVDFAIKKACLNNSRYNRIWCVFDKDEFTDQNFNEAIKKAEKRKIGVAYSNKSFELWLYLHFHLLESALDNQGYIEKLNEFFDKNLKRTYKKNDKEIYSLLKKMMDKAMRHAKKLYSKSNKDNPAKVDPSTTVHLLIKELQKKKELSEL